jgi:hypothetical protein
MMPYELDAVPIKLLIDQYQVNTALPQLRRVIHKNSQNRCTAYGETEYVFLWILLKKNAFSPSQKHIGIREIIENFCG